MKEFGPLYLIVHTKRLYFVDSLIYCNMLKWHNMKVIQPINTILFYLMYFTSSFQSRKIDYYFQ